MAKLIISIAQMNITLGDERKNIAVMEQQVAEAAARRSNVVLFPELWSSGYAIENSKNLGYPLNEGLFKQLSGLAVQNRICIVGSTLEKRGDGMTNSATFFAPNGRMLGVYRKLHLFRLMNEDRWLKPGESPLTMDLPWGVTGLAICYDLRFPELFRQYSVRDKAKIVFIPAEWPIERVEHWRTLLRARAIENQMFVVSCNAAGKTGEATMGGNSSIIDPWGKVVVEAGDAPCMLTAEIELDLVDEVRNRIPVFEDRRTDVYD